MRIPLQPSAAHRWLNCTASPRFLAEHEAELPKIDAAHLPTLLAAINTHLGK